MASELGLGEQGNLGWGQADSSRRKIGTKVPRLAPRPGNAWKPGEAGVLREGGREWAACSAARGTSGALWTGPVVAVCAGPPWSISPWPLAGAQSLLLSRPCPGHPLLERPFRCALAIAPPGGLHSTLSFVLQPSVGQVARVDVSSKVEVVWADNSKTIILPQVRPRQDLATWLAAVAAGLGATACLLPPPHSRSGSTGPQLFPAGGLLAGKGVSGKT